MQLRFLTKKNFIIVIGLFAIAVIFGSFMNHGNAASDKNQERSGLQASLSGFKPGTDVVYKIISPDEGQVFGGEGVVKDNGAFDIPIYNTGSLGHASLHYDLRIERAAEPLNINFKINPDTGNISVFGAGLQEFSDILINGTSGQIKTKADWAGLFEELNAAGLDRETGESGFQVAMYNNNGPLKDIEETNPLVVEVLIATGGGGPTGARVNWYKNTYCGSPPISVCNKIMMQLQINNIVENYVRALMMMTEQLSAVMMHYVYGIGMFLDAKMQLEAQRDLQQLQAEAHKDYHPSRQMCRFGSTMRSIAAADVKRGLEKRSLNKVLMTAYVNSDKASSSEGYYLDINTRLKQFREVYCDPKDNNDGLEYICQHDLSDPEIQSGEQIGAIDPGRSNKDVNFGTTVDFPLTLDVDFRQEAITDGEEDVIALARNLYWPEVLESSPSEKLADNYPKYQDARRLFAMYNIAHNSFVNQVALKASAKERVPNSGWKYMKFLLKELGVDDEFIDEFLGENASYYAQMDVLTKKIYQDPDFYTHLYDKPANVKRIGVAMDAIKLMQMRDLHEASLRREMSTSLLVEKGLKEHIEDINAQMVLLTAMETFRLK